MMTIEICDEQLNAIVIKKLATELSHLKEDYEDGGVPVFSYDRDEERKKVKRLIAAFERVLDWYGVTP